MKSLNIIFLNRQAIPIEMGGLLQKLGEYKGRQALSKIHAKPESFPIDEKTILSLHRPWGPLGETW